MYQHFAAILSTPMHYLDKETNGVLFLMDEFPTLGKMDLFFLIMPYFRGYRIILALIAQNLSQLKNCCGEMQAEVILSNCAHKIVYATNQP